MDDPFISQIMIVPFSFAPRFWAQCNGQLLPINSNQALFSLLGVNYGGNGTTNFALPNLRGRAPIHFGDGYSIGQESGQASQSITINQIPNHSHGIQKSSAGLVPAKAKTGSIANTGTPEGNYFANNADETKRFSNRSDSSLGNGTVTIGDTGGNQAHNNMQPYLVLNYVIALNGFFPPRN